MKPNRTTLFLSQEEYERLKARYPKLNEPWQPGDLDELKAMAADKVPLSEMSEQLGRTPNSLKIKLKSLGLYEFPEPPKKWSVDEENKLVAMYNDQIPFEEMADHFGRSVRAVVARLVLLRVNLFPSGSLQGTESKSS